MVNDDPAPSSPLVSVIVPVYNGEAFLAEALCSCLDQDYAPVELIVVDDGSLDATAAIVRSFAGVRYVHQVNQGPAAARNTGIRHARGELIAFHDADDLMLPGSLSARVDYLREHPDVGCLLCRQAPLVEPGSPDPAWLASDAVFGDQGGVIPTACLVRADVVRRVGGFDPAFPPAEGFEWLVRLRGAGVRIAVFPEILMRRRLHAANLTREGGQREGMLRALKGRLDRRRRESGGGA